MEPVPYLWAVDAPHSPSQQQVRWQRLAHLHADEFVGMEAMEAEEHAAALGVMLRVVPPSAAVKASHAPWRVNAFTDEHGVVTRVEFF